MQVIHAPLIWGSNETIKYDMDRPTVSSIKIPDPGSSELSTVTTASGTMQLKIVSSEALQGVDLSNVTVTSSSGKTLFKPFEFYVEWNCSHF